MAYLTGERINPIQFAYLMVCGSFPRNILSGRKRTDGYFTFAIFLGLFGFILLFGFQFTLVGVITLIIAALIVANPASIAYLVASFLLLYGVSNLIRLYQNHPKNAGGGDGEVSVQ